MLMTCRLRLVRRRSRPLGHNSGRAWRGALVRQRPPHERCLHRRLVRRWRRRRGLWRRHELTVAAIRRRITVLSQRCTAVGVGVRRWCRRGSKHGAACALPFCTVHADPRVMGRRGRTPMLRCRSESGGGSGRGAVRRRHDCGAFFRLHGSFETAAGPLPCRCVEIRHRLCYRLQAPAVMRVPCPCPPRPHHWPLITSPPLLPLTPTCTDGKGQASSPRK